MLSISDRRYRRLLLLILTIAIGLRLFTILDQPLPMIWDDSGTYVLASRAVTEIPDDRPLGYSWFLRILRAIDQDLRIIVIVQALIGIFSAVVFSRIMLLLRPQANAAALMVLLMVAIWPGNLLSEQHVLSETLFLALMACGMYALARARSDKPVMWAAVSGVFCAGAVLVRSQGLYFVPSLLVLLLLSLQRHRLRTAAAFALVAATVLTGYSARYFMPTFGVHGVIGNSGIVRFVSMIRVIRPEYASDRQSAEFIRHHMQDWQYPQKTGYGMIVHGSNSPVFAARDELHLSAGNGDLNRWAGRIGWEAIRHNPLEFLRIGLGNLPVALTARDMAYEQESLADATFIRRAFQVVYGVDVSAWSERARFAWQPLRPLRELKYLFALGLAISMALFFTTRQADYFLSFVILGFVLSVSFMLIPEERYLNVAENLSILNAGILLADLASASRSRKPSLTSSSEPLAV